LERSALFGTSQHRHLLFDAALVGTEDGADWGLDLPATGLLLAVAAILTGFSVFAATAEEQLGKG